MSVGHRGPIRGRGLSLTPFGMCRSTHPLSNSRSFCTYKTTSHLHIPQLLKVPQFQCFAPKSLVTLLASADARMQGRGSPLWQAFRPDDSGRSSVTEQPPCFQALTHSRNRQFVSSVSSAGYALPGRGGYPRPYIRPALQSFRSPMTTSVLMNKAKARSQG